jgi:hypothetical protein
MAQSIKGTRTEKNLLKAFAGESQAKNRYTFFAKQAKREGFEQISEIFMVTAMQEVPGRRAGRDHGNLPCRGDRFHRRMPRDGS